jgi:GIY-YIG catalytic domain
MATAGAASRRRGRRLPSVAPQERRRTGNCEFSLVDIMYYVYFLRSERKVDQRYIGFTGDLKKRLLAHNNGESVHTSKYLPWNLVAFRLSWINKKHWNLKPI